MAKLAISSTVMLTSGHTMPALGLGVFQNHDCADAIKTAVDAGYRHIDSAIYYRNEKEVGEAVREAVAESGGNLKREDLFITSKIMSQNHGYDNTIKTVQQSLKRFKLDYLDLFLIHDPYSGTQKRLQTWRALIKLRDEGKLMTVGVSNYGQHHIEEIKSAGLETPAVNQLELHPWCQQRSLVEYCFRNNIAVQAYSPLTKGVHLKDPVLVKLAKKHNKDTAQILIRWSLQKGFICLPKSSTPARVISNSQVYDFELDAEDMRTLDSLDQGADGAVTWHPVTAP
ncbi:hypothetical protein FRC03_003548 [Tulasnella sp. 419]|nr:hypothetical protein FRC02_008410 [Tulasnella sp. 418]KAG8962998.1 hypothetical protein FRC03_003548 [Tulasnella sp. 419]